MMPENATRKDIDQAAALLRSGQVVGIPTETVYGLAANALDPVAVARVFEIKQRPFFDPLIVHIPDLAAAASLVIDMPAQARQLAAQFWPGPLTLVLPRSPRVPDIVTAGMPSVALRIPDHPLTLALLHQSGLPLAAPSANRFGHISPTTAAHVREEFGTAVPLVLDGGPCRMGIESTVISLLGASPALLRPGAVPREAIEAITGPLAAPPGATPRSPTLGNIAPGMVERHYAPATPLDRVPEGTPAPAQGRTGLLTLTAPSAALARTFAAVEVLAPAGDLPTAAANLFAAMRRLDAARLDHIFAYPIPTSGLGLAINDRLRRASCRK